jgi:hypothetical protein
MAKITSTNINAGDPVTADIINNLVLDLNELNKATAPTFKLTLGSTGTETKPDAAAVSQKIYSKPIPVTLTKGDVGNGKWDFTASNIKFSTPPRCWIQVNNSNTGLSASQFDFTTVITSVSTTSMTFQVRGPFASVKHTFMCFAADA